MGDRLLCQAGVSGWLAVGGVGVALLPCSSVGVPVPEGVGCGGAGAGVWGTGVQGAGVQGVGCGGAGVRGYRGAGRAP